MSDPEMVQAMRLMAEAMQAVTRAVQAMAGPTRPNELTKRDVCDALRVSPRSVDRYVQLGVLPPGRLCGKRRVWCQLDVELARKRLSVPAQGD